MDFAKLADHLGKAYSKPGELARDMPDNPLLAGALLLSLGFVVFAALLAASSLPDFAAAAVLAILSLVVSVPVLLLIGLTFALQKLLGGKAGIGHFTYLAGLLSLLFFSIFGIFILVSDILNFSIRLPLDLLFLIALIRATNTIQEVKGWKAWAVGIAVFLAYIAIAVAVVLVGAVFLLALK